MMLYNLDLGYLFNLISCLPHIPSASLSACVQGHTKPVSTSGPLRWLFPLPGMPFPWVLMANSLLPAFIQMSCLQRPSLTTLF